MIGITSEKIRSIIQDCNSEMEIAIALRQHKIKYSFTTDTGFLSIRIPCRKGVIRVFKTCSRSYPFTIHSEQTKLFYPAYNPFMNY